MVPPETASTPPPSEVDHDPNEVELAWSEEIERRVKKVREGTPDTVSEEEFFRRLRSAK